MAYPVVQNEADEAMASINSFKMLKLIIDDHSINNLMNNIKNDQNILCNLQEEIKEVISEYGEYTQFFPY